MHFIEIVIIIIRRVNQITAKTLFYCIYPFVIYMRRCVFYWDDDWILLWAIERIQYANFHIGLAVLSSKFGSRSRKIMECWTNTYSFDWNHILLFSFYLSIFLYNILSEYLIPSLNSIIFYTVLRHQVWHLNITHFNGWIVWTFSMNNDKMI